MPSRITLRRFVASPVFILGASGGVLLTLLRWTEYQFLVLSHSLAIYGALTAVTFSTLGILLGLHLTRKPEPPSVAATLPPVNTPSVFLPDATRREALNITPRELEILALVARGFSNREIAAQLFVSENTVKTHCSRAFDKLGARRRTQAVQFGKELGILP